MAGGREKLKLEGISVETWNDSLCLARPIASWLHDLLSGLSDWIIALVGWHLDALPLLTRQDVEATVALVVDVFGSHQGSHTAVLVVLGQLVAIVSLVVVQIEQVVRCAALVFLACIELILFDFKSLS